MSKWRPVTSGVPQGLVLRLALFHIFVGNMDSETEGTLSKFAKETKPRGAVNILEGQDAIQDMDKDKCKFNWAGMILSTNTGWVENGLKAALWGRTCGCW